MDMAEIFISPLISKLVENLASGALSYLAGYEGGIDDKLNDWRRMFLAIEAVLADAEERQITDRFIQQWLQDLQLLAYDIEDLVDDLATEGLRRQMLMVRPESSRPCKLRKLVHCIFSSIIPSALSFNHAMNSEISKITSRLQDLVKRKNDLTLGEYVGGRSEITGDLRLPSTSLVDQALVYGREEDRSAILTTLLEEERPSGHDGKVCVISIVGMGGMGKTTLAQSLYNTDQVKSFFDLRAWVCVSEDFDVFKISKIIYEEVYEESCKFNDLNKVQVKLQEKLSNKKFLLVLDDVWNDNYAKWDLLRAPFQSGAPGSRIIVTTRYHKISQTMGSIVAHDLKELSDGDCLSLLAQHALQRPNFDRHPDLKEIGEVIAKKCKGLPLAAKSLGGILRTKESSKQWRKVSSSKIWELPPGSNDIIPALRLSYHHLPSHLKPMFVYCSIFPKDYKFDKQELVLLWMAQGFLRQSGEQKQMEELGSEYFSELLSRSFFQHSGHDESRFVMHDLMNELAQFVAGVIYSRWDSKMESEEQYKVFEEARHASFISHKFSDFKKFKALNAAKCLRTLLPIHENSWGLSYLSNMALKGFPSFPYLRVLSLRRYFISELPKSIGNFKHMQYLDFSMTAITELPETVCGLYNLQTLLLHGCHELVQLPTSIQSLISLRHLNIVDTPRLKQMPLGIGTLTHLRTLSKIIIDESSGLKITELKGLPYLQGTLSIIGMENVTNVQDAMEANLFGKKDLDRLEMKWSSSFDDTRDEELEFKVLQALEPQIGLASLEIEFYGGQKFPSWIGDRLSCKMVNLTLSDCKKCVYLPSLGHLSALKNLVIKGMHGVKTVGPEFFGAESPRLVAFESLISLRFEDMDGWEEWSADMSNGEANVTTAFPRLLKIEMFGCLKLSKVSLPKIPSLEELTLSMCSNSVLRSMAGLSSVKKMTICDIRGLTQLDEEIIRFLEAVEDLLVTECDGLRYLWQEEVACHVLVKIKLLTVWRCKQLVSLGDEEQVLPRNLESLELSDCDNLEKMPNWQSNITSLGKLNIRNCKKLKNMSSTVEDLQPNFEKQGAMDMVESSSGKHGEGFSNLNSVSITRCPCLTSFPTGKKLPTALRHLEVWDCENLEVPEEVGMCLLESIYFHKWSNLKSLPKEGFAHLTRLKIHGCEGIESIPERSLSPTLTTLEIYCCKNLKYFMCSDDDDDDDMQSLTSLRELSITRCENVESYPSRGRWPPNLISLRIGDVKQPIMEWGLATLPTSLRKLAFEGDFPELVSFTEVGKQLPTSTSLLTSLEIGALKKLESLSKGLENLSSLEHLMIWGCPKLRSLPSHTLLHRLSRLVIFNCPLVKKRCEKEKGDYWPSISHIPFVNIDLEDMW